MLAKIITLLESIENTPFEGIGKPEELKFDLTGKWSRRLKTIQFMFIPLKDITNCRR